MDQQLKEFLEGLKESDIQGTKTYTKIKWFARVFLERKNRPYEEYETFASSWGVLDVHHTLLCCLYDNV